MTKILSKGFKKYIFTVTEAAKYLSVCPDTLRNWEEKGKLIPQRTKGNSRRYYLQQLNKFLPALPQNHLTPIPSLHLFEKTILVSKEQTFNQPTKTSLYLTISALAITGLLVFAYLVRPMPKTADPQTLGVSTNSQANPSSKILSFILSSIPFPFNSLAKQIASSIFSQQPNQPDGKFNQSTILQEKPSANNTALNYIDNLPKGTTYIDLTGKTIIDSFGNIYPANGTTASLGTSTNRYKGIYAEGFTLDNVGNLTVLGLTSSGTTTLGASISDQIKIIGRLSNDLIPTSTGEISLGDGDHYFKKAYFDNMTVGLGGATSFSTATLNVTGNSTLTGDLAVNGGDLTSTSLTFNLLNSGATTINLGGAATSVNLGAATGTTTINNNLYTSGNIGIGTTSFSEQLALTGRVNLGQTTAPSTTTDKLYNVTGNLFWNGTNLTGGGALPAGTLTGQTLYWNSTAWNTSNNLFNNNTNVGIGTTSPLGILHVAGQCVTGDTLLKRRRRRKKRHSGGEGTEPIESDDKILSSLCSSRMTENDGLPRETEGEVWEDVRIDEIKPGDEILTLDEKSGEFEVSKVHALQEMGIHQTFQLTTETGKKIRTTSNHPYLTIKLTDHPDYLVQMNAHRDLKKSKPAFAFIDEVGISYGYEQPNLGVGVLVVEDTYRPTEKLHKILEEALSRFQKPEDDFEFKFKYIKKTNVDLYRKIIQTLAKDRTWQFHYNFEFKPVDWKVYEKDYLWKHYLNLTHQLISQIDKPLIVGADYFAKPAVAEESIESLLKHPQVLNIIQLESQGSLLLQATDILLGGMNFITKQANLPNLKIFHEQKKEIAEEIEKLLVKEKRGYEPSSCLSSGIVPKQLPFVKGKGKWTKVDEIFEGNYIAVLGDQGLPVYERVNSIVELTSENVFDIEVEGTHNFVANGIVAHNTYINGNVGIGITSPTKTLDVTGTLHTTGAVTFDSTLYATSSIRSGNGIATADRGVYSADSVTTGNLYFGGAKLGTDANAVGVTLTPYGSVNATVERPYWYVPATTISIGGDLVNQRFNLLDTPTITGDVATRTVTNASTLYVGGAPIAGSNAAITNAYALYVNGGQSYFGGNVGIGTVAPLSKLGVLGNASIGATYGAVAAPVSGLIIEGNVGIGTTGPGAKLDVRDGTTVFSDADVAHGVTDWAPTTAYGQINISQATNGGVDFLGLSDDAGQFAARLYGIIGVADPTDTVPAVVIAGAKANGTGVQALGALETVAQIRNTTTELVTVLGSGNVGIGTVAPLSKLGVLGNASIGATYGAVAAPVSGLIIEGNVGIGTTGPGYLLDVNKDQDALTAMRVKNLNAGNSARASVYTESDGGSLFFQMESSTFNLGAGYELLAPSSGVFGTGGANGMRLITSASAPIIFGTGGYATANERMRITSTGNVGIGTVAPLSKLGVLGNASIGATYGAVAAPVSGLIIEGNVGIGTTGPSEKLDVVGKAVLWDGTNAYSKSRFGNLVGSDKRMDLSSNLYYSGGWNLDDTSFAGELLTISPGGLEYRYGTAGTNPRTLATQFFINSSGNVGIGDISPAYLFTVGDGDLFGVNSSGYALLPAGAVGTPSLTFTGDTNTGIYNTAADKLGLVAGGTETMTITNGNVGIGTTGPNVKLEVNGDIQIPNNQRLKFGNGSSAQDMRIWVGTDLTAHIDTGWNTPIVFEPWGNERMRITGGGNVGIGTTGPNYPLEIVKNQNAGTYLLLSNTDAGSSARTGVYLSSTNPLSGAHYGNFGFVGAGGSGADLENVAETFLVEGQSTGGLVMGATNASGVIRLFSGGYALSNERVRITSSGNVGIGTVSPLAKLHVAGQCVTGNTLLPIRRRRRRKSDSLESDENDEDYDYLLCRIDEILPGDEVLSLNEEYWNKGTRNALSKDKDKFGSGALEYARINKLMDMGMQDVYEIVTKSGRRIRTTENHPYLTLCQNLDVKS